MGLRSGLCRPVKFFHNEYGEPVLYKADFVHRRIPNETAKRRTQKYNEDIKMEEHIVTNRISLDWS